LGIIISIFYGIVRASRQSSLLYIKK
jgi:hypothetical protein